MPGKPRTTSHIGRKRRTLGWTLLSLGLLLAGGWGWSGWQQFGFDARPFGIMIGNGVVSVYWSNTPLPSVAGLYAHRGPSPQPRWEWLCHEDPFGFVTSTNLWLADGYRVGSPTADFKGVRVQLWFVAALLTCASLPPLRSGILARRHALSGACANCGYSLAGLAPEAPCPECGKTSTVAPTTPP